MTASYESTLESLRNELHHTGTLSMLSFTIAGIQDFLSAARTTRDVWNGSYLVSHLSRLAAEIILDRKSVV